MNRSEEQSIDDFSTEIHKIPHIEVGWLDKTLPQPP
jgi:hypothetical protein